MEKNLYEVFDEVEKASSTSEKIETLRKNKSPSLILFLQAVYKPDIVFSVNNIPHYTPSENIAGISYSNMTQEIKRAYIFQKHHPKRPRELSDSRQEQILIQLLESLEPREAKLFANMLLKKLEVPTMSKLLAESAFPGIF